jgi:hypothetical protein
VLKCIEIIVVLMQHKAPPRLTFLKSSYKVPTMLPKDLPKL